MHSLSHEATKPQSQGDISASLLFVIFVPWCEDILWLRPVAFFAWLAYFAVRLWSRKKLQDVARKGLTSHGACP